jgi:MFS family permease
VRAALDTKAFWLLFLAATAQPLVNTALVFHHMSLITGRGMPLETAAASLSIVAPAVLAGSLMAGFASPRFPIRFCLAAGQGVLLAAMVLAITLDTPWQAMVYGCCMGLATGLLVTGGNLVWPAYFGRTNIGSIRGVTTMGVVAAAALGPLPFGFLFDVTGSYQTALIVFLPLPALCAAAALAATPPRARAAT